MRKNGQIVLYQKPYHRIIKSRKLNLSSIQQESRKEYFLRINRVVDYIDAHLDEEHTKENPPTFTVDICVPVNPL